MEIPASWKALLDYHRYVIDEQNVDVFTPDDLNSDARTISLIYRMPLAVAEQTQHRIKELLPAEITHEIIFTPPESYNFTVQWAPDEAKEILALPDVLEELNEITAKHGPFHGTLYFPYFGRAGLFGMLLPDNHDGFSKLRAELYQLWQKYELKNGINPPDYDLIWTSLVRYNAKFSESEINLLRGLKIVEISDVTLSDLELVRNDKLNLPEKTEVIKKF